MTRTRGNGHQMRNGLAIATRMGLGATPLLEGSYRPEFDRVAFEACARYGAEPRELARTLGVPSNRLHVWLFRPPAQGGIPSFQAAVRAGRDAWTTRTVERTLLQRALGYPITETVEKESTIKGTNGKRVPVKVTLTKTTMLPPDVLSLMFWLENRSPHRWKDMRRCQTTGLIPTAAGGVMLDLTQLGRAELEQLRDIVSKAASDAVGGEREGFTADAGGPDLAAELGDEPGDADSAGRGSGAGPDLADALHPAGVANG